MTKICFMKADNSGCGFYRMDMFAKHLRGSYETLSRIVYANQLDHEAVNQADVYVIQRRWEPGIKQFVKRKKKEGKVIIFEIDDNIWRLPENHAARDYWDKEKLRGMASVASISHAVITGTVPLQFFLERLNRNVYVVPNYIEKVRDLKSKNFNPSVLRVGFAGSDTHRYDLSEEIIQVLLDLKEEYRKDIELVFFGYLPSSLIGNASYFPFVAPSAFLNQLAHLNIDIGIAPCIYNEFNNAKSANKFIEYSAVGTATVASPVYPYIDTITEEMGIVVQENKYSDWKKAIKKLMGQDREQIVTAAHAFVKEKYLIQNNIGKVKMIYEKIIKNAK